jgi:hypothetical protein
MKYLFLCGLVLAQFTGYAQNNSKVAVSNEMIVALNAEQMIEKVGFENLTTTFFDNGMFKKRYSDGGDAIVIRKSLAALYGAGIDFKRKFWVSNSQYLASNFNRNYEEISKVMFLIPVANKAVFQEHVLNILNDNNTEVEKASFTTANNVSYYKGRNNVLVLTDKDFIVYKMPYFNPYTTYDYRGRIIKTDTLIIPKSERFNYDYNESSEDIEAAKNREIIEVDKVMDNGKIVRLLKNEKNNSKISNSKIKQAPYADEVKTAAVESATEAYPAATTDTAMAATTTYGVYDSAKNVIDTLTDTDYINDSIRVKIYYIPYTDAQRDSANKVNELAKVAKEKAFIADLLKNVDQLKVYDKTDIDTKKIKEAKEDIAMISTSAVPNMGGSGSIMSLLFGRSFLGGGVGVGTASDASSYLSFVNFENGKAVLKSQTSCCNTNNKFVNDMYLPVSNFWPKEVQKNSTGIMHVNLNLPLVLNYFTTAMGEKVKLDNELKKKGIELVDVENAFSGEVVLSMSIDNKEFSNQAKPHFFGAIKLKDAKKAVSIMNKLASGEKNLIQNYQFDENGTYMMLYSKNRKVAKVTQKEDSLNLPTGTFGTMRINVVDIVNSFINDGGRRKDNRMNAAITSFFGKVTVVNNKTEDGNFIGEGTFDMGSKDKNALVNLFSFINEMAKHNEDRKYEETKKAEKYNDKAYKRRKADKLKNETQKRKVTKKH